MNTDQAKQIPLIEILEKLGFVPIKSERGGQELKYLSPFRAETEPSFNLNVLKNAFYDFGLATGGNTVDFAIEYLRSQGRSARVTDALQFLSSLSGGGGKGRSSTPTSSGLLKPLSGPQIAKEDISEKPERRLKFIRALPLTSKTVLSYLKESRAIPQDLATKYLHLVQYHNLDNPRAGNKPYFGFGMKNRSGGYEIRSASDSNPFKSALIKRDISIVKGTTKSISLNIFEGMLDFLSHLHLSSQTTPEHDGIIMHSLSSYKPTLEFIGAGGYQTINLWLDNDQSGQRATKKFMEDLKAEVIDHRKIYEGSKDLNKFAQSCSLDDSYSPDLLYG